MKQLILFGLPGVGKSYIGRLLSKEFGYIFFEGDSKLTDKMIHALNTNQMITDEMRDEFMNLLVNEYDRLSRTFERVVLSQTFLQEKHRQLFHTVFPHAAFILVEAPQVLREKRYMERTQLSFSLATLRANVAKFEPIAIPHYSISNNTEGNSQLLKKIKALAIEAAPFG